MNTFVEHSMMRATPWTHVETMKLVQLIADEDCLDMLLAKRVHRNADMFERVARKMRSNRTYDSCRTRFKALKKRFKSEQSLEQKTGLFVAFHCWETVDAFYCK